MQTREYERYLAFLHREKFQSHTILSNILFLLIHLGLAGNSSVGKGTEREGLEGRSLIFFFFWEYFSCNISFSQYFHLAMHIHYPSPPKKKKLEDESDKAKDKIYYPCFHSVLFCPRPLVHTGILVGYPTLVCSYHCRGL